MVRAWLQQEYVARWWNHETSEAAIARDFGPSARGEEPNQDWIAMLDGTPFGLMQRSAVADYPENVEDFATHTPVPAGAMTLDYLIGDPDQVGRGRGPEMIRSMVEKTWQEYPDAPAVLVAVVAANRPSWRALEKAGMTRVAEGDLEPDNPIDEPLHYIYRIDRPA